MLLWLIFAFMTVIALGAVLFPFLRLQKATGQPFAPSKEIYHDQLGEIDRDLERGLIEPEVAEAARIEIARRILHLEEQDKAPHEDEERQKNIEAAPSKEQNAPLSDAAPSFVLISLILLCLPILSLVFYLQLGSPSLPAQPFAAREVPKTLQKAQITTLIEKVEQRLRSHPEDGRGWDVIAPVYFRQKRYNDARIAYRNALKLLGPTPMRLARYGEAIIFAENGIVTEDAQKALQAALKADDKLQIARFWMAVLHEQDGDYQKAVNLWQNFLQDAPENTPWRAIIEDKLKKAKAKTAKRKNDGQAAAARTQAARDKKSDKSNSDKSNSDKTNIAKPSTNKPSLKVDEDQAAPGPSQEDVKAAQNLSRQERSEMINQMVAGLADRLEHNGDDLKGWLRLIRSYYVLNKQEEARAAAQKARKQFKDNPEALNQINQLVKVLQ